MVTDALNARDFVLPFVGAVAGYVVGILQTVAADRRDRAKARNKVLYILFQLLREVRASNPQQLLPLVSEVLVRRFGAAIDGSGTRDDVVKLLAGLLRKLTGERLRTLGEASESAVQALVPTDPLLALRLTGARITRLEDFVKDYYKLVQARPEVATDPNAPRILATMEAHALDLALKKTVEELSSDIRVLAASCWIPQRRAVLQLLQKQNTPVSAKEFEAELGEFLDELVSRVRSAIMASSLAEETT